MKFKDYEPINFKLFQSEIEKLMFELNNVIKGKPNIAAIQKLKDDYEMKIKVHREENDWK